MQTSTVNPSTFECLAHYLCIYIHIEGRDDLKGLKIAVFDMHSCSTVEVNETSGAQNLKKMMFMKPKNNMCSSDPTVNIFYPFDPMNNVVSGVCVISSITRHYFSK